MNANHDQTTDVAQTNDESPESGVRRAVQPFVLAKACIVETFERAYLTALMEDCAGNIALAASRAELARHHLRRLLRKHDIYRNRPRASRQHELHG
jgi:DNA-binding NtrC family response regulator